MATSLDGSRISNGKAKHTPQRRVKEETIFSIIFELELPFLGFSFILN
jgi:hypothetical protein